MFNEVENEMPSVEALMNDLARSQQGDKAGLIVAEHLATGGKRLRARLALAAVSALGGRGQAALGWAAACELLHNATLIHDDLQDGDRIRRGHPTAWVAYGMPQAINAGDLGLLLPFAAIEHVNSCENGELRWALAAALASGAANVIRGQAAELELASKETLTWDDYERAVVGKTSALFRLPVEGAALIAGRTPEVAHQLAEPFSALGVLFQVQDDVLDLFGDKGRGEVGSDIREGKISALVVEHLTLYPKDSDWLRGILKLPRERTPQRALEDVIDRFAQRGALDQVRERILQLAGKARGLMSQSDEQVLSPLLENLLDRVLQPIQHVL